MELEERKKKFVLLLEELLEQSGGVKARLAEKLEIIPSRLTRWLQGKIDPASLEVIVFDRLAKASLLPTDFLIEHLGILEFDTDDTTSLNQFKNLIEEMLTGQTQEQLGKRLSVSQKTISGWINPQQRIDPSKIPISTVALIAKERGWTVERLIAYLRLKDNQEIEENLLARVQSLISQLSFPTQLKLQIWFFHEFETKLKKVDTKIVTKEYQSNLRDLSLDKPISNLKDTTVCIILETEDLAIVTNYASNLAIHLNLKPENIKVTTIPKLPESIADIDVLIFDISTPSSESLALIEDIEFDRDIVVFANADLPSEVRSSLEDKVTDVVVKPIDWQKLKDKAYFS